MSILFSGAEVWSGSPGAGRGRLYLHLLRIMGYQEWRSAILWRRYALVAQISGAGEIFPAVSRILRCAFGSNDYPGWGRSRAVRVTAPFFLCARISVRAGSWGLGFFVGHVWEGVGCQRLISRAALGCHLSSRSAAHGKRLARRHGYWSTVPRRRQAGTNGRPAYRIPVKRPLMDGVDGPFVIL